MVRRPVDGRYQRVSVASSSVSVTLSSIFRSRVKLTDNFYSKRLSSVVFSAFLHWRLFGTIEVPSVPTVVGFAVVRHRQQTKVSWEYG